MYCKLGFGHSILCVCTMKRRISWTVATNLVSHTPFFRALYQVSTYLIVLIMEMISILKYHRHGLWTPNEGLNQRNLKIWANLAEKI